MPVSEGHFVLALLEVVPAVHGRLPLQRRGLAARRGGGHHQRPRPSPQAHGTAEIGIKSWTLMKISNIFGNLPGQVRICCAEAPEVAAQPLH